MLPCRGVLPRGVFGGAQVESLELLYRAVNDSLYIYSGDGHGQEAHRGKHAVSSADIVGHDEALPALGVRERFEHAALCIGGGENVFFCGVAVFLLKKLPENAEGERRLKRGAGF